MNYEEVQPPDYLSEYVRYFWRLESSGTDSGPKTFRIVADGCPGLIFQYAKNEALYQYNKQLPTAFLYGQSTQHTELRSPQTFSLVGVCFYPNALKPVFGIDAHELTDSCVAVDELSGNHSKRLVDLLPHSQFLVEQTHLLAAYLGSRIRKCNVPVDPAVQYAVGQISESQGTVALRDLRRKLQVSERSFERKFRQTVGISPKLFARICRFQASLNQLRTNNYNRLSDIAFDNGYADQSHFIRGFNQFAGFSPDQYRKQLTETVLNFPELSV